MAMFCDIALNSVWWKSTLDNGDEDDDGNDDIYYDNDHDDGEDNTYEDEDSNQWIMIMMVIMIMEVLFIRACQLHNSVQKILLLQVYK